MLDGTDITARSAWLADMLARKTGEAVWIGRLADGEVHLAHQAARPDRPVQRLDGDSAIPWHACALGHAIVAGLDPDAQEALLARPAQRLTGLTVTEPEKLRQALALTRHRGYAVEAHAATLGEAGIAAPVFDSSGRAVAAIGIVGPAERLLSAERLENLAQDVLLTAGALSQDAGRATQGVARTTGQ
jgi:DNA-binding IclR family transcriptional regulator